MNTSEENLSANRFFPEIKRRFGFGCMRLPRIGDEVDIEQFKQMTDRFLAEGFNYFDTAHGYLRGKSELAIREGLTSRWPRERYILTDKLTGGFFEKEEDIRPLFESQLKACGVEYFDFYLMHAQGAGNYDKFRACRAYETAFELKKEGKVRHVGISFHDTAEFLDRILTDYPALEVVQIQFNYADYEDPAVQSRKVYEVCRKHGKPVIVMEPVKGGNLVKLPEEAAAVFDALGGGSYAGYALRFAAGFEQICMILSGMSSLEQLEDNTAVMREPRPLDEREREAVERVNEIFHGKHLIPCTACRYCTEGCPQQILIPDLFHCYNSMGLFKTWNAAFYYEDVYTVKNGKASDCVGCGQCESVCPQHLPIRALLKDVAKTFEKNEE
ncbi:MAG: aldo/keto reductase [Oscillospiraceae bacterium]|nr:aldo/keto reductase [Oscillospiraceae bacterium]